VEAQPVPAQATPAPVSQIEVKPELVQTSPALPPNSVRLQTGVFGKEANAQALVTRLVKAGFLPSVEQRIVNGNPMWAVTVPAGQDTNRTIKELRDAGFDSFPVK
jgi:cell division septation protein DedD